MLLANRINSLLRLQVCIIMANMLSRKFLDDALLTTTVQRICEWRIRGTDRGVDGRRHVVCVLRLTAASTSLWVIVMIVVVILVWRLNAQFRHHCLNIYTSCTINARPTGWAKLNGTSLHFCL